MSIKTLMLFLLGDSQAIRDIGRSRSGLWVALVFVLSAGLARSYDTTSLVHEPWHVLGPLVASTIGAAVLFWLITIIARVRGLNKPGFVTQGRVFLTLYWMTAPTAWLYGIPYEQFFTEVDAAKINIATLAVVAAWRVLLMSRVIAVLYDVHFGLTFPFVMLFGVSAVLPILFFTQAPLLNIMGGLQLSETEQVVASAVWFVMFWGTVTFPIWLLWSIGAIFGWNPKWSVPEPDASARLSFDIKVLMVCSILFWCLWMPWTQPSQYRKHETRNQSKDLHDPFIQNRFADHAIHTQNIATQI